MLEPKKIQYVNASEVCEAMGIDMESPEYDMAMNGWSYGDTMFSFVGNIEYLSALVECVDGGHSWMPKKYWDIVPNNAFINLEVNG